MAKQGILPRHLATCPISNCQACFYVKNTKKPWRSKTSDEEREAHHPVVQPGEWISINMMTSLTPRLITQMSGKCTCKRYCHAAVYVNQATGLGFVWLQKSVDLEDTMEGKIAFERFCQEHGITVQHYHADNGIFTSNTWRQSCLQQGQGLTFSRVAAHHQNGIAERWIMELQEMACMMLIHAHHRWPSIITPNLWLYALRMANDAINVIPISNSRMLKCPLSLSPGPRWLVIPSTGIHLDAWHMSWSKTFRQTLPSITNGNCICKLACLGCLPQHARDVSLVLNLDMGQVSPQFHVKLDSNFQTLREKQAQIPPSSWQIKCSFVQQPTKASQQDLVPQTGTMTWTLPMQPPEGAQPTANDNAQLVPETKPIQDQDPEPQELPPLRRSRHLR